MDTRVAILAIIAHDNGSAQEINAILHEHAEYIIGRMGLPYRERGMNIISVAVDAPQDVINSLAGKGLHIWPPDWNRTPRPASQFRHFPDRCSVRKHVHTYY